MPSIDKIPERNIPQRAPRNREAPVSFPKGLFKDRAPLNFTANTGFQGGPSRRRKGYRLALWSWVAAFVDALILLSLSCVFLISFSLIVNSPVGVIAKSLFHTETRALFFIEAFAVCTWMYLIVIRVFMGSSIGEWACDLRLGNPHERMATSYVLRVLLRSTLILATGVVMLPLLSLLFGKDIPGVLSGLRLLSLK